MTELSQLDSLLVLEPLEDSRVLGADISGDDILDESYLLNPVFEPMQLGDYFIPLVHQIGADGLRKIINSRSIGIRNFEYPMQLG